MTPDAPLRTIAIWCPDWPITAVRRSAGLIAGTFLALIDKGIVFACSSGARQEGVRQGQRVRDAQARCQDLLVLPYDAALDMRSFEMVLSAIEETMPGVQLLRPGTCLVRARGPVRYYGSEEEAALWLLDTLDALGIADARVGIADGPFTAEQAAHVLPGRRITIVPEGDSAAFLAPMPVGLLGDPTVTSLLKRLGIHRLGQFAQLSPGDVEARFGEAGAWLHALASGRDSRPIIPRLAPAELDSSIEFEPPLDRVDQVSFGFRTGADRFIEALVRTKLVCTALRIEVESESGELSERRWLHPRSFTAGDVIDRLRWQLQGSGLIDSGLNSRITKVRVIPESVDAISHHEVGLWGSGADEGIHHGLSRVQSMLGHGGALTATLRGGRMLLDRQHLSAWGDRPVIGRSSTQPWPGQLPAPYPGTVFVQPLPVAVLAASGEPVDVDDRGMLNAEPSQFSTDGITLQQVDAWAGPWPIDERWWDSSKSRRACRFQVVNPAGIAWLLVLDEHRWWAEARYD